MKPHPSLLRCNIYQASPFTRTIIALDGMRVVGTVSVIRDSELGLPSDKPYGTENDSSRHSGYELCEISAFAIDPAYRKNHGVLFKLVKYLYFYATQFMKCTMVIATINPKGLDFYRGIMNFKRRGKLIRYDFAGGAPSIHISMDCLTMKDWFKKQYQRSPDSRNLYSYFFEQDDPLLRFPSRRADDIFGPHHDSFMTPELLEHFFLEKTDVLQKATFQELSFIKRTYGEFFDLSKLEV